MVLGWELSVAVPPVGSLSLGSLSLGSLSLGSPWAAVQSPSSGVVPPASSFPTSSGEIAGNGKHFSEGRFQDEKRGWEGSSALMALAGCCSRH